MRKTVCGVLAVTALMGLSLVGVALASNAVDGDEPAMMASPNVIVLAKVSTVTVHTNVAASAVAPGSLALNGVAPLAVWADNLGHVAARFALADLNLAPGEATLTLTGLFKDGGSFSATDVVTVK